MNYFRTIIVLLVVALSIHSCGSEPKKQLFKYTYVETIDDLDVFTGNYYSETKEPEVIVAEDEGILDVAWFIYEFIELNIPIRHVHAPGKCDSAMVKMLEEYSAARSGVDSEDSIDPRWAALAKLKNKD